MFLVVMPARTSFGRGFREQTFQALCDETWVLDRNYFSDAGVVLPFAARRMMRLSVWSVSCRQIG